MHWHLRDYEPEVKTRQYIKEKQRLSSELYEFHKGLFDDTE